MRPLVFVSLLAACTKPTWVPGLPSGISQDTAGTEPAPRVLDLGR